MEFHIITSKRAELVMRVEDGQLEIVPPAPPPEPADLLQKYSGKSLIIDSKKC